MFVNNSWPTTKYRTNTNLRSSTCFPICTRNPYPYIRDAYTHLSKAHFPVFHSLGKLPCSAPKLPPLKALSRPSDPHPTRTGVGQSCAGFRRIRVVLRSSWASVLRATSGLSIRACVCVCVSVRSTVSVCARIRGKLWGKKLHKSPPPHPPLLGGRRVVPEGNKNTGLHSVPGLVSGRWQSSRRLDTPPRRLRYTPEFLEVGVVAAAQCCCWWWNPCCPSRSTRPGRRREWW